MYVWTSQLTGCGYRGPICFKTPTALRNEVQLYDHELGGACEGTADTAAGSQRWRNPTPFAHGKPQIAIRSEEGRACGHLHLVIRGLTRYQFADVLHRGARVAEGDTKLDRVVIVDGIAEAFELLGNCEVPAMR